MVANQLLGVRVDDIAALAAPIALSIVAALSVLAPIRLRDRYN